MIRTKSTLLAFSICLASIATCHADEGMSSGFNLIELGPTNNPELRLNAWNSGWDFVGNIQRDWAFLLPDPEPGQEWLGIWQDMDSGGMDVTLGTFNHIGVNIQDSPDWTTLHLDLEWDLTEGDGIWWTGAKMVVSKQRFPGNRLLGSDDYECYIVEYHNNIKHHEMVEHFGLENGILRTVKGVPYWHYTASLTGGQNGPIKQVWSIRASGKTTSLIDVGAIKKVWLSEGLIKPEHQGWYAQGWLFFYEAQAPLYGTIVFKNFFLP